MLKNITCPNTNTVEWAQSVGKYGINGALRVWLTGEAVDNSEFNAIRNKLRKILPNEINVEIVDKIASNPDALGVTLNNMITLTKSGVNKAAYHEAFHAIFRFVLTENERSMYSDLAYQEILKEAKENKTSVAEMIRDKKKDGYFSNQSLTESLPVFVEEWLADKFQDRINKQTEKGWLGQLFNKLKTIISSFVSRKQDLNMLFKKIESGAYNNSAVNQDSYYNIPAFKLLSKATRGVDTDKPFTPSFKANETDELIRDLASYYYLYKESAIAKTQKWTDSQIIEKILDLKKAQYSDYADVNPDDNIPEHDLYHLFSNEDVLITEDDFDFGFKKGDIIVGERTILKNEISKYLKNFKRVSELNDENESLVDDIGDKTYLNAESKVEKGWGTLPEFVREFIASVNYETGKTIGTRRDVVDGVFVDIPVMERKSINPTKIYNGLLRALANQFSEKDMVEKLLSYGDLVEYEEADGSISTNGSNKDTYYFVKHFLLKTGLDINKMRSNDPEGFLPKDNAEAYLVYRKIIQGFNRWAKDTLFTQIDTETKESRVFLANRKNVAENQFSEWHTNFKNSDNDYEKITAALSDILPLFSKETQYYKDQEINEDYDVAATRKQLLSRDIGKVKNALLKLGIDVSPNFIKYSLLYTKLEKLEANNDQFSSDTVTEEENRFLKTTVIASKNRLSSDFITQLLQIVKRNDSPFEFKDGETFEKNSAAVTKIKEVAKGNALLDESVFESSYLAADGTMRYLHQDGTYHLKAIAKLKDAEYINQLRESGIRDKTVIVGVDPITQKNINIDDQDKEFVTENFLWSKYSDFLKVFKSFKVRELDGIKALTTNYVLDDDGIPQDDGNGGYAISSVDEFGGTHYGDMTSRDFAITLLNLYSTPETELDSNNKEVYTVPQLISVMETSKSSDYAYMPVITGLVNGDQPSDKMVEIMSLEIRKEFNRINKVHNQLNQGESLSGESLYDKLQRTLGFVIDDYHTKGRGLLISDKLASLVSKEFKSVLEQAAVKEDFAEWFVNNKDIIDKELVNGLNRLSLATLKKYEALDIIQPIYQKTVVEVEGQQNQSVEFVGYKPIFLSNNYTKENEKIGFNNNISHNITQANFQQLINSIALSHLIHGDNALLYKNDNKDPYKREKTNNAKIVKFKHNDTIESLGVTPFNYSNVLIIEDPKEQSTLFPKEKINDGIDIADAQMWCSVKARRNYLHGLGRLTPQIASLLDKMEAGIALTSADLFSLDGAVLAQDGFINSEKLVFRDAKRTIKMSVVPLTKTFTSMKIDGVWVARPDMEVLHDMREAMEKQEIDFVAPKTAFKTYRSNILQASTGNKDSFDFSKALPQKYDNEYFGLQMENPTNKDKITVPTQLLHSIDSEQNRNGTAILIGDDQAKSIGEITDMYNQALGHKFEANLTGAAAEMYNRLEFKEDVAESIQQGKIIPRLAHFQRKATESLKANGADPQLLEFFEVDDFTDQPKYNLNNDLVLEKYEQLYLAHFSKGSFSAKTPGHSVSLFSNFGIKLLKEVVAVRGGKVEWRTIRRDSKEYIEKVKKGGIKKPNWALRTAGKDVEYSDPNLKVGDVFTDKPAYNVPEWENNKIVGYYSEMIMPYQTKEHADVVSNETELPALINKMFGNRIPLQDKHSMLSIKWVDTLPLEYGSTAVFPSEIIELSGADFDIDKLYLTKFDSYYKDGEFHLYGDKTTKKEQFSEYLKWTLKNNKFLKALVDEKKKTDKEYLELMGSVKKIKIEIKNLKDSKLFKETQASKTLQILIDSLQTTTVNEEGVTEYNYNPSFDFLELDKETRNRLSDVKRFNALTATLEDFEYQIYNIKMLASNKEHELLLDVIKEEAPELPHDIETFNNKFNVGYNNNVILKSMLALLTNDHVRNGIADQPATQDYIESAGNPDGSKKMNPAFVRVDSEGNKHELFGEGELYPIDSMIAHITVKSKNNIGKDNIGIDVAGNVQNTIFKKAKIFLKPTDKVKPFKLYDKIDESDLNKNATGHRFSDLSVTQEFDFSTNGYTGKRTMDSTSSKISSSTDEAKDGNNAKLNLGAEESKILSVGNGLKGIPLQVMISLVNQPVLKPFLSIHKDGAVRTEKEREYNDVDKSLEVIIAAYEKKQEETDALTAKLEIKYGNLDRFFSFDTLVRLQWGDKVLDSFTDAENEIVQAHVENMIFMEYASLRALADQRSLVGDILKLNKGIKDFGVINDALEAAYLLGLTTGSADATVPFDVRHVFTGDKKYSHNNDYVHHVSVSYLKKIKEISELAKLNFISKTKTFKNITSRVTANWFVVKREEKVQLNKDLLSFATIASFKTLMNNYGLSSETFTNRLIMGSEDENIINIYKKIKKEAPDNPIIKYLITNKGKIPGDTRSFSTLKANSFTRLTDMQLGSLINGYIELYQNEKTRQYAKALLDYVMIKDGLQFKNKTISKILPAEMFDNISLATNFAHDVFLATNKKGLITAVDKINSIVGETPLFSEEEKNTLLHKDTSYPTALDLVFKKAFNYNTTEFYNRFSHLVAIQPVYAKKINTVRFNNFNFINYKPSTSNVVVIDYKALNTNESRNNFNKAGFRVKKDGPPIYPQFVQLKSGALYKLVALDGREDVNGLQLSFAPGELDIQDDLAFYGYKATYQIISRNTNPEWNQMSDLLDLSLAPQIKSTANQQVNTPTPIQPKPETSEEVMDIWYGKEKKETLSNLAPREFTDKTGKTFLSVEHAYQSWKSGSFDQTVYNKYKTAGVKHQGALGTKTENNWNIDLMKRLVKASFEQNSKAEQDLLATGDKILTHEQDKGIWKTEFPRILMEVRDELHNKTVKPVESSEKPQAIPDTEKNNNIYPKLGDKTVSENIVIKDVYQQEGVAYAKSIGGIFSMRVNSSEVVKPNKLFDSNDKELKKGSVVEYNDKKYLFWNDNNGKAQLINTDGTKFSGTPNIDKLNVLGNYKTTIYNNTEYIVTDNNNIYSGATGNLVYTGNDNSSKVQKQNIIDSAYESLTLENNSQDITYTPDQNFGNPFSSVPNEIAKGLIATKSTKESVEKYIDWILNNEYDFDNIDNVFLLAMPAESKLDHDEKGRFSMTDKTVLIKKKDIKTALIHELVHEYINTLPESKRLKLYEDIYVFSEKVEKDEYFQKAKGLYGNLQSLQKQYGKDEKSPQYAEEIINIFLGNRVEYSTIHDLINSKYEEEFYRIIKDIDLKRIQNKADRIIKKDKVHTELKGYHDKYTVPYLIEPQRRNWIRKQLESDALKNKPIVYYKDLGEPSHATALDYLINKYGWNVNSDSETISEEKLDIKVISKDYGVLQSETNPSKKQTKSFVDIIAPQVLKQAYKENKGKFANEMFHYGLMWARTNKKASPVKINAFDKSVYYAYHELDQNGSELPSLSVLQPIINEIQNSLNIDMSDYDSVIGNIYLDGQYIYPHKDTSESKSARNYPVIVYTLGNDAGLGFVDNNEGKMTFANQYDTQWLQASDKLKGYTNELKTKNGSIYTFGYEGKGRFELTHSTPIKSDKKEKYPPLTLPNGQVISNYTITLTFRRSKDLESDTPITPKKLSNTQTEPQKTEPIREQLKSGTLKQEIEGKVNDKTVDISTSKRKSPYFEKDKTKFRNATKLISRGSADSSSTAYRVAAGSLSNTGVYSFEDVVAISAEGNRSGRRPPDFVEIQKAINANVKGFITDIKTDRNRDYNIGEREVAGYLIKNGYVEIKDSGRWIKPLENNLLDEIKSPENKQTKDLDNENDDLFGNDDLPEGYNEEFSYGLETTKNPLKNIDNIKDNSNRCD